MLAISQSLKLQMRDKHQFARQGLPMMEEEKCLLFTEHAGKADSSELSSPISQLQIFRRSYR